MTGPDPATRDVSADLAIIGAGPAGLFAAYYAGFRGLSVAVVDALPEPGGQITAMYPEKRIYDVAGFPAVTGRELVERLVAQAETAAPRWVTGERAMTVDRVPGTDGPDTFSVGTDAGTRIAARAVVVAGGIGAFTPRPLPAAPGILPEDVAYFVRRLDDYAGLDVAVIGGGDSAFDWAVALSDVARTVTLVHRRAAFRAHSATVEEARRRGVRLVVDAALQAGVRSDASGRGQAMEGVYVATSGEPDHLMVPCQRIIAALGFSAHLGPILDWGVDIADRRHVVVDSSMHTSRPGVFAAGDITTHPGKVPLIVVGFGEAATAVNNACHHLEPEASIFPGHSTDSPLVLSRS